MNNEVALEKPAENGEFYVTSPDMLFTHSSHVLIEVLLCFVETQIVFLVFSQVFTAHDPVVSMILFIALLEEACSSEKAISIRFDF